MRYFINIGKGRTVYMFKNNSILNNMIKSDKRILLFFFLLLTIIFAITIIINLYLKASSDILIGFLNAALILIFILTGILSFHYYRMSGIISTKKMFKWFFSKTDKMNNIKKLLSLFI